MGLRRLLEACQVHEKRALKHSSKSTQYEVEGSYDDLVHELSWTYHAPLFLELINGSSNNNNCARFLTDSTFSKESKPTPNTFKRFDFWKL